MGRFSSAFAIPALSMTLEVPAVNLPYRGGFDGITR